VITLASYKLRVFDEHVRAVPAKAEDGCVFAGPGVDLRGADARAVLAELGPVRAWLEAREPGVTVRSFSVDLGRLRVLVTLAPPDGTAERPRVLRFDPPSANELVEAAAPVEAALREACTRVLRPRRSG
jgi:hypothetical protein